MSIKLKNSELQRFQESLNKLKDYSWKFNIKVLIILTRIEKCLNDEIDMYNTLRKDIFDTFSIEAKEDSSTLTDDGDPIYKKGDKIVPPDSNAMKEFSERVIELNNAEITISLDETIPMHCLEMEYEKKTDTNEVIKHKEPIITDWFLLEKLSPIITKD